MRPLNMSFRILTVALIGALGAINLASAQAAAESEADSTSRAYQIIRSALQLRDVPLNTHSTCRNAAPALPAISIGDYLAGFLANMAEGSNRVTTACQPLGAGQRCEVWLKHADEEDEWAWGIRFEMDRRHKVRPSTVQCLGSG